MAALILTRTAIFNLKRIILSNFKITSVHLYSDYDRWWLGVSDQSLPYIQVANMRLGHLYTIQASHIRLKPPIYDPKSFFYDLGHAYKDLRSLVHVQSHLHDIGHLVN